MGIENFKPNQEVDPIESEVDAIEQLRNRIEEKAKSAPEETKLQMLKAGVKKWGGRLLLALGIGTITYGSIDTAKSMGKSVNETGFANKKEMVDAGKTEKELEQKYGIDAYGNKINEDVNKLGKDQGLHESAK